MRFELNKAYVFFAFQFKFDKGRQIEKCHAYPTTDLSVEIVDVKFINAVCKEHHKVHYNYDETEEKKYDGFLFEADGIEGRNQYPTASYGQMDDSSDRELNFLHAYFEKYGQDFDKITEADPYLSFTLFTNHMENLERGLYKMRESAEANADVKAVYEKLLERKKLFCDELAKQLNMEIVITPHIVKYQDGTSKELEGFFEVNLKELSK